MTHQGPSLCQVRDPGPGSAYDRRRCANEECCTLSKGSHFTFRTWHASQAREPKRGRVPSKILMLLHRDPTVQVASVRLFEGHLMSVGRESVGAVHVYIRRPDLTTISLALIDTPRAHNEGFGVAERRSRLVRHGLTFQVSVIGESPRMPRIPGCVSPVATVFLRA